MTEFRRSGTRRFIKIYDDNRMVYVTNKSQWSEIKFGVNPLLKEDVLDPYTNEVHIVECTEKEFDKAYKYALDRITMQRLDI